MFAAFLCIVGAAIFLDRCARAHDRMTAFLISEAARKDQP